MCRPCQPLSFSRVEKVRACVRACIQRQCEFILWLVVIGNHEIIVLLLCFVSTFLDGVLTGMCIVFLLLLGCLLGWIPHNSGGSLDGSQPRTPSGID